MMMTMAASAQILFDGKKAAVDNLTGTWLLTVPEQCFGNDYTAAITLDQTVTQLWAAPFWERSTVSPVCMTP